MTWKEMLLQALMGLLEILATIGKAIGIVLVSIIKIWEPICCAALGFALGHFLAQLISLESGTFKIQFQLFITFLGLVFGAALATRRLKRN